MAARRQRKQKGFYFRSFAVFILFFDLLVLTISGVVLYIAPPGRYTNWVNWQVFSVTKAGWEALHINFSWLFVLIASLHIYFNWRVIRGYLRRGVAWTVRYRWELAAAAVVTALFAAGSVWSWPVFADVVAFGEQVKAQIEAQGIQSIASWQVLAGVLVVILAGWALLAIRSLPAARITEGQAKS